VSWNLDVADASLLAPQGEVTGEVPWFVGRAVGGGEHQPGFLPGVTRRGPVAALPLGPEFERGHADVGQRQGGFGGRGLGLAVVEVAARAL
jgi:hypothetical protein